LSGLLVDLIPGLVAAFDPLCQPHCRLLLTAG